MNGEIATIVATLRDVASAIRASSDGQQLQNAP